MNNNIAPKIKVFSLNSFFRRSGESINGCNYEINESDIIGYKVKSAVIPIDIYTIDSRNNKVYIDDGTAYTATIASGFYNSTTILVALKTALDATASALVFTCTYNSVTNKITISATGSFSVKTGVNNAYYELGITTADLNISAASLTPTTGIDLSGLKVIYVYSNLNGVDIVNSNSKCLLSIPIDEQSADVVIFKDDSSDYIGLNNVAVNSMNFILYDERNRSIQLSKDYIFTLALLVN